MIVISSFLMCEENLNFSFISFIISALMLALHHLKNTLSRSSLESHLYE